MNPAPSPLDYSPPPEGFSNRRLKIGLLVACLMLMALVLPFAIWGTLFARHMALARQHIPIIRAKIAGDPRFLAVNLSDFSKHNGSLLIEGGVASDADLAALQQIVAATVPPVFVDWAVGVNKSMAATTTAPAGTGVSIETMSVGESQFTVARIDLRRASLRLFWKNPDGSRYGSFDSLRTQLAVSGLKLVFATNAGIFDPMHAPLGLHVEEGRECVPLNLSDGAGNFFLKPNGVFFVDANGAAIVDAVECPALHARPSLATQSGPLLLRDGKIHPAFRTDSQNRKIRSGVGIVSAKDVVFVLSNQPVTFFEFAAFFQRQLGCNDALYLDGEISRFGNAADVPTAGDYAGILAVVGQ